MVVYSTPLCNLCRYPLQGGGSIRSITHVAELAADEPSDRGTPGSYTPRTEESQSFHYHQSCVEICPASLGTQSLVELGQTLRPALPVNDPAVKEHALQTLKLSCCPQMLSSKVKVPCKRQGDCECLKCVSRRLSKLPPEVFTEIILMAEPSIIPRLLTIFGETSKLLSKLKTRPARHATLSCQGNVFQTSVEYGGKSYITGLYDHEIPHSIKIKSEHTLCDHIAVWTDQIGVTEVEFLRFETSTSANFLKVTDKRPSIESTLIECRNCVHLNAKNPLIIQSKREWVHLVAITEAQVYLEYKGIFVERVSASFRGSCRTLWDCSKSTILLPAHVQEEISLVTPDEDVLLRYVPLKKSSGISVAFSSGRLQVMTSHGRGKHQACFYDEADDYTVCMYCPLSDDEKIEGIWAIRNKYKRLKWGVRGIIVKTQMKLAWLGHYLTPQQQLDFLIEPIADESVSALYYSDPRVPSSIVGAQPYHRAASLDHMMAHHQTYRPPIPELTLYPYNMHYSEAPLEGVFKIQACMDNGYCLGILFDYGSHSRTVGQYRYDKEISHPYKPHCINLLQEENAPSPRICLQILNGKSAQSATKGLSFQLTHGTIVWWYTRDISLVSVVPNYKHGTYTS